MVEEHVDTIEDHDDDTMGGVDDDSFRVTGVTEVIGDPIEKAVDPSTEVTQYEDTVLPIAVDVLLGVLDRISYHFRHPCHSE